MKKAILIIAAFLVILGLSFIAFADAIFTPMAWETYQIAADNLHRASIKFCEAEKNLAEAKLKDHLNKSRPLDPNENLLSLIQKSEQECEKPLDPKLSELPEIQGNSETPEIQGKGGGTTVSGVNISCLAFAVAKAETNDCTTGMGVTRNNCFGIMTWDRGFREGKTYATKDEAYADFRRIWESYYGGYPTWQQAKVWTGNDSPSTWYANMESSYNSCRNEPKTA